MRRLRHACLCLFLSFTCFPVISQSVHYVNANVQGGNGDGSTWDDAFPDLQSALAAAEFGDSIWVAKGTYHPTVGTDRYISFEIPSGIILLGGFDATESYSGQRNWEDNLTVLSGDIGIPSDSTDNAFTVVYFEYSDSTTLLDGFTIAYGNANSDIAFESVIGRTKSGAGIYIEGSGNGQFSLPTIRNCHLLHNSASFHAGAIYCNGGNNGSANPVVENCIFEYNFARRGGCIFINGSGFAEKHSKIDHCVFDNNYSVTHGGTLYYYDTHGTASWEITNSTFKNSKSGVGGVINYEDLNDAAQLRIDNCLFSGNIGTQGGAIHFHNYYGNGPLVDLEIRNSTFNFNYASHIGGAMLLLGGPTNNPDTEVQIHNCTFFQNGEDGDGGGVVQTQYVHKLIMTNNLFERNNSNSGGALYLSISDSILLIGNTFHENFAITTGGAFVLNSGIGGPSYLFLSNNIFQGNFAINNPGSNLARLSGNGEVFINHCLLEGSSCDDEIYNDGNVFINCGIGNIFNQDPLFVNPNQGDFRLLPCSPARNAGDNAIVDSLGIFTDLEGNPRIQEGSVDMGAYETPAYAATLNGTTSATCYGLPNGGVAIGVQSGCPPFTLDLGGASTVSLDTPIVLQGLPAGSYQLAIVDAQGRADTVLATIGQPPLLVADALVTDVSCTDGTPGSATAQASGGTPGYAFAWSNGSTGNLLDSLLPGSYALTVTDSPGCTAVDSFMVETAGEIEVDGNASDALCHGDENGTADAVPLGGTAPFAWLWGGGQTDSTLAGLPGGTYSATVTDALGCTGTAMVQVIEPDPLILQIAAPMLVCFETSGAEAVASALGGTLPYSFEWQGGETGSVLLGIGAGSYAVTLSDGNGCTEEQSVEVEETTAVFLQDSVINATSPTASDGGVLVSSVMGGMPPYSFLWDNGSTSQSLENLPPGAYTLTVTDSLGCAFVFEYVVDAGSATGVATGGLSNLSVYPNPASAFLTLEIALPEARHLELRLLGPLGRELYGQPLDLPAGHTRHRLDLPLLTDGLYLLSLGDGVRTVAMKVVVQR